MWNMDLLKEEFFKKELLMPQYLVIDLKVIPKIIIPDEITVNKLNPGVKS